MTNPYIKQQRATLNASNAAHSEGWALVELARRLDEAAKLEPFEREKVVEIVRLNWRIWTIFQSELSSPECTVPPAIRSNLLNLAGFVDKRSVDIISRPTAEKLTALININRQIGAGLMESAKVTSQEQQAAMAEKLGAGQLGTGPGGLPKMPQSVEMKI